MTLDLRHWRDIDEAWLSAALRSQGVDAKVQAFRTKAVGTGQIGDCVRFDLEYSSAPQDAPTSLVGKFPADAPESRDTGIRLGNYFREVKFYQELQASARITTPFCYAALLDNESHEFIILMEDLAPAEQGDQLVGLNINQARAAMVEAAKLHGAFWNDARLDEYEWVSGSKNAPKLVPPELAQELWTGFKAHYSDRLNERSLQIGETMCANFNKLDALRAGNKTLVHADFRPDNMMFASANGGKAITVVDWQSFGFNAGGTDIGYFLSSAIPASLRREHEGNLLNLYLQEMERAGAIYPNEEFERHYICGAYQHFLTAFIAAMMVQETDRGNDMFFQMLNGAVDLIHDRGAHDWFE